MNTLTSFHTDIKTILEQARSKARSAVNAAMVEAYWLIGQRIVEEEQLGQQKAQYGKRLIEDLSAALTADFGKGFSYANLYNCRQFYLTFPKQEILYTACRELSWSHLRLIMRVEPPQAVQSPTPNTFAHLEFIKDPYVLEFLQLPETGQLKEIKLEQVIIDELQKFLLEMGKGFSFVARQMRISTETSHFYLDLVFYNYLLKCFVIIDLKTGKLSHKDIGQMDMYVRMFDDLKRGEDDNPTIGIILCDSKDETIVKYSVIQENQQLSASKYQRILPTEAELIAEIEREKRLIEGNDGSAAP
jgi:predicted nuclease of restriction endonuclease-like (RecB) superfamily